MAYPSVPNTFASQTTFIASQINANLDSILSSISSGSDNVNVNDVDVASLNVASTLAVSGSAELTKALTVTGNATHTDNLTINDSASYLRVGLGTYEVKTIASYIIIPTKSYVALNAPSEHTELTTITATNFSDGDLMVLTKDPASAEDPIIKDGTGNIQCGADRTLNSNSDKLILQYSNSEWYMIYFSSNA